MEDLEKKGYQLRLAGFQDESEEVDNFNVNWRVEHRCYDFFAFASKHEKIVKIVPVPLYMTISTMLHHFLT